MLYIRMMFGMIVSFYTSRVVLDTLGIDDFGINNVVAGTVSLFTFIANTLVTATQRFLSFDIGKNDKKGLHITFNCCVLCFIILGCVSAVLMETIGLWLVNTKLNLPQERMVVANWIFQFSVISFVFYIIRVPYSAMIIAHERMSFYAYVSIAEVFVKLAVALAITISPFDKLMTYRTLGLFFAGIFLFIYIFYCRYYFAESRMSRQWDKNKVKEILNYSTLSMMGAGANIGAQQGGNILMNIYGNVAANAAFGVAGQVSGAVTLFVTNFQTAFNPQIVKLYAAGALKEYYQLIERAARVSFYLLFIISLPLIINLHYILDLWLVDVPNYCAEFCLCMILFNFVDAIQAPIWMAIYGTGNIKTYQIIVCITSLANIPISWLLLYMGFPIITVLIVRIIMNVICSVFRTKHIHKLVNFPYVNYIKYVVIRSLVIALIAYSICAIIKYIINLAQMNFLFFCLETFVFFIISVSIVWAVGINSFEKEMIRSTIVKKIIKR